ncbi:MAG TPA: DNA gyrase inhibitor YacG [Pelovirga sp.]|nr:DNA gyrase inhibitor YacG [Pelovirga sp.]
MEKSIKTKCPYCRTLTPWQNNPSRPFCSERCRMIDLGRWDNEEYAVAGEKVQDPADDSDETPFPSS